MGTTTIRRNYRKRVGMIYPATASWQNHSLSAGNASSFTTSAISIGSPVKNRRLVAICSCAGFQSGLVNGSSCTIAGNATTLVAQRDKTTGSSKASIAIFEQVNEVDNTAVFSFSLTAAQDSLHVSVYSVTDSKASASVTGFYDDGITGWVSNAWTVYQRLIIPPNGCVIAGAAANVNLNQATVNYVGFSASDISNYDGSNFVKREFASNNNIGGATDLGFEMHGGNLNAAVAIFAAWG